jgi:hypothetical protein
VHGPVFPWSVFGAVHLSVDAWRDDSRRWAAAVLRQATDRAATAKHPVDLDTQLSNLAYDSLEWRNEEITLRAMQWGLERLVPILTSIDDCLACLRTQGIKLQAELSGFIDALSAHLSEPSGLQPPGRLYDVLTQMRRDRLCRQHTA